MFSLPRKLSTSLGIGDDPKLVFRTQPSGIRRLVEARNVPSTDDRYWSQFALLFDSASDVYSLISPHDIRRALNEAPENLSTLVNVISTRLFSLVTDHTFPSPPPVAFSPVANIAATWASVSGTETRDTTKELLNCLRVLGRVLPIVFESETSFEHDLLWKRKKKVVEPTPLEERREEPQFVIAEDSDDEGGNAAAEGAARADATEDLEEPLAVRLMSTAIDLMFCCGFTLPPKIQVDHHKINHTIWEKGIGSTLEIQSNTQLDHNKTEVLRFIEIMLSKSMYSSPTQILQIPNPYVMRLVHNHQTPRRLVLPILCSLLNTSLNSGTKPAMHGMASVGNVISGVGGIVKDLPYNHLVWKDEGRAALVSSAFGVLLALLDYQTADSRDVPTGGVEPPNPALPAGQPPDVPVAPTAATNSFRYFLAKLHRPGDLEYMLNGVLGIWEQHMSATHHVLPGSRKGVPYILESFLLFWKIIDLNKKFRSYVLESDKLVDVFAYMLWFLLEHKDKPQHHGFCRVLSYMIQVLSGESSFGSKLSQPIPGRVAISARWATPGSVGDFFVTSVYYMVATTSGQLNFLYPALIIALANCAPHLQNLQVISSTRLLQLFTSFSSPAFLLADDGHPRLLFFMLEVLNQIIYHQFSANPNVIYAILRSHKRFESMGTFTLAKGLKEIQRIKEAKEEAERLKSGNPIEKGKTAEMTTPTRSLPESPLTSVDEGSVEKLSSTRTSSDAVLQSIREEETDDPVAVPPTPTAGSERVFPTSAISSPPPPSTRPLSEKARGKMKEQGSVTEIEILDPELERVAAAGVGRNGFVPTQDWVASWQQGLPLDTVLLVISELLPKVHELQASSRPSSVTAAVIDYLKVANLKDVLPQPPSIITRRFQWSDASIIWLSSMIWGEIFVKGTTPLAIWNNTNVKLFGVKHTPQARSVTNFVGGLLGNATGVASGTAQDNGAGHARRVSRQM